MKTLIQTGIWSFRFAIKDAKASAKNLSLVGVSIILALASLVALLSFRSSIEEQIDKSAQALVGADFIASSRQQFNEKAKSILKQLPAEFADERGLASMAYVAKNENSRLVSLKAVSKNFPLYGEIQTQPADASQRYHKESAILIDKSLALQLDIEIGDILLLGESKFPVLGFVLKSPGLSEIASSIAPRVYLPLALLESTQLIKRGSRVRSTRYFKKSQSISLEELIETNQEKLLEEGVSLETLAEKQETLSKLSLQVNEYLSILAFLALLLGAIGLSGALHYYLNQKRSSIAALRCLGAKSSQIALAFLIQILLVGSLSILCGIFLGVLLQPLITSLFSSLLPGIQIAGMHIAPKAILSATLVAYVVLFSFALLPLANLFKIEPLEVLRSANKRSSLTARSIILWLLLVCGILVSALLILKSSKLALLSTGVALVTTLLLYGASLALKGSLKKLRIRSLPFSFKQGIANLYRPQNQTATLFLILGLGVFSSCIILLGRELILEKVASSDSAKDANIIAFDVQQDQLSSLERKTKASGLVHLESVPIVSMTLKKINNLPISRILSRKDSKIPRWSLTRTYRSTYRDKLTSTEKLIRGRVPKQKEASLANSRNENIPVTISQRIAKQLQLDIGNTLDFDIQGMPMKVTVVGVRKIDWQRFRTNFFIVFPNGILEEAPQNFVLAARSSSEEVSAQFQKDTVKLFPNVSIIDLRLAQDTLNQVFEKIKYAVAFLSGLSIITAVLVLLITLLHSRKQREKEYSLLRVLGGNKRQLRTISLVEHTSIAICASLLAVSLSSALIWAAQIYVFQIEPHLYWKQILSITLALVVLVNLVAGLSSRAIFNTPLSKTLRT